VVSVRQLSPRVPSAEMLEAIPPFGLPIRSICTNAFGTQQAMWSWSCERECPRYPALRRPRRATSGDRVWRLTGLASSATSVVPSSGSIGAPPLEGVSKHDSRNVICQRLRRPAHFFLPPRLEGRRRSICKRLESPLQKERRPIRHGHRDTIVAGHPGRVHPVFLAARADHGRM